MQVQQKTQNSNIANGHTVGDQQQTAQLVSIHNGAKYSNETDQNVGADLVLHQKKGPNQGTFEKTSFNQLMSQYDMRYQMPPTLELTQAFLMTQNMGATATRVQGLTQGGNQYFLKNDYVGDSYKLVDVMQSVNRLVLNLGVQDKASNFLIEQRNLLRSQCQENKVIRELINEKIIDGLEYVRQKEKLAEAKSNAKEFLDDKFTSDEESKQEDQILNGQMTNETEENSEVAQKNKEETQKRIENVIKQLRRDGKIYLNLKDQGGKKALGELPLSKLWQKLRKNERYQKKRETKAKSKEILKLIANTKDQLEFELDSFKTHLDQIKKSKSDLEKEIEIFEQVHGLEKRLKVDNIGKSVAEIDQMPLTSKSFELQNILFDYCGINLAGDRSNQKGHELFGRIKKLPQKSTLLQCYQDQGENKGSFIQNEKSITNQARKKNVELVKVIGIEPDKFFGNIDKYKIRVDTMPKFSNVFERAEPLLPGLGMTVAGSLITGNQGGQMSFARVDGRNVISLQFNPYELEDPQKKKIYDAAVKDLVEQREKIKSISKGAKEKSEQSTIKRAWQNIVKKDIPKAFRSYQKYKTDLDNNNKKQSTNCLREVRKRAQKTQKLSKESVIRAKKLTKEMMNFWKRRDKELADLKRRKEKFEREIKKKQEEERENLLQKKRLEFIMQQSEIYAHFMSKKLGLLDEQQKQRQQDMDEEKKDRFQRVDIDEMGARNQVASIINENLDRVNKFDSESAIPQKPIKGNSKFSAEIKADDLTIDKFDNPDSSFSNVMKPPVCLKGNLKDYQLKGLKWLDNLYEQGINGILADEMGLGKTIQAISLLAHLYENKGVWGPFLVIVPVTTLHNWQNELQKFCPTLKVLPYFGNPEERKKLGRFLDPKNLYNPQMQVNVLLTSYNLIVNNQKDQAKLLRVKWHYMILDEAQAIKNNLSRRWKILLQFNTRNRLLLTGTPIQNTMAELWALLHFIMPKLFDSHEQFQEWFSKDIEQSSFNNQGDINKHQLKRLHLVLKPFMLRRLKKDVEQEIGPKVEFEKYCEMTHRQRVLYQRIKNKISTKDLFQLVDSKAKMENLMNLVMQFRKVCNHPELFERRVGRIPFQFRGLQQGMNVNPLLSSQPEIRVSMKNPIQFQIPKMIYDECMIVSDNQTQLFTKLIKYEDIAFCQVSLETHMRFFNIFNTYNMHQEIFKNKTSGGFGILRLLTKSNNWSLSDLSYLFVSDPIIKQVALMHYYQNKQQKRIYFNIHNNKQDKFEINYRYRGSSLPNNQLDIIIDDFVKFDQCQILYEPFKVADDTGFHILPPMIPKDLSDFTGLSLVLKRDFDIYVSNSQAETQQFICRSGPFNRFFQQVTNSNMIKKLLLGKDFKPKIELFQGKLGRDRSAFLTEDTTNSWKNSPPVGYELFEKGILGEIIQEKGACLMDLPNYSRLVSDCAKMQFLDKLLTDLKKNNHRCLIFCQMTRMLDILEDFLCWRKYTYFRMDGSTSIPDRRYMVEEYQKNKDIFAFLLSTRAGGLGVNLTGADTVIFYDNDWNPTMDAQATDRAHRIGQTKKVSVYRIITKGTVEEKIVKRAKQKQNVQSTVYGGNALKADVFRPKDVVEMLLDEQEQKELQERGQKFLKSKRIKRGRGANENGAGSSMVVDDSNHHFDEPMQINTSTAKPLEKQFISPMKVDKKSKDEGPKKPGRKPNTEKPQQAQKASVFTTQKQEQAKGPFNVFSVSKVNEQSDKQKKQAVAVEPEDDDDDVEMQEEIEEEEEEGDKIQKLLGMLQEKDVDDSEEDEDGVQFEYNDDEIVKGTTSKKAAANAKNQNVKNQQDEEEEDMDGQVEEY